MLKRLFPIARWLPKYSRAKLPGDIMGGVTVGLMVIPQGLSYAKVAGLPLEYGLYSSFPAVFMYCFFGTAKDATVGPTAVLSSITLSAVHGDVQQAILLCLFCGILQLVLGLFRAGFVANFISRPVLSGFVTGAAITIGLGQVHHVVGYDLRTPVLECIYDLFALAGQMVYPDLVIGLVTMLLLFLSSWKAQQIKNTRPAKNRGSLFLLLCLRNVVVVVIGTAVAYFTHTTTKDGDVKSIFALVGHVPKGLPAPVIPAFNLHDVSRLGGETIITAFIAFLECYSIGKAYAERGHYTDVHDANQELIALGAGNIVGSFFSAFPATGSFSRTAVNSDAGANSGLSAVFTSLVVILALLVMTPAFYWIPQSVLSAVIIMAVFPMVDLAIVKEFWQRGIRRAWTDILVYLVSVSTCTFYSLEYGIVIGVGLHIIVTMVRLAVPHMDQVNIVTKLGDILLFRMNAPLTFANAEFFLETIQHSQSAIYNHTLRDGTNTELAVWSIAGQDNKKSDTRDLSFLSDTQPVVGPLRGLLLDMSCVSYIDETGLGAMKSVVSFLHHQAAPVPVHFVHTHQRVQDAMLNAMPMLNVSDQRAYFHSSKEAALERLNEDIGEVIAGDWHNTAYANREQLDDKDNYGVQRDSMLDSLLNNEI